MADQEIMTVKSGEIERSPDISDLMRLAIERGAEGVEALEKLVALRERVEDRNARHAFHEALATFQQECPPIPKTSAVKFVSRSGGAPVQYSYAALDTIIAIVRPILARHGLSFTWDSVEDGGKLTVTCVLLHVDGCSQRASFTCPLTSSNPIMSDQQKSGAALTYARRQSLVQALGLVTTDTDNDAASTSALEPISDDEVFDLTALISKVGANHTKFLELLGVAALAEIPKAQFATAKRLLERKRGTRGTK
jgi:hypothetical protein